MVTLPVFPPTTIICVPVQTARCSCRGGGTDEMASVRHVSSVHPVAVMLGSSYGYSMAARDEVVGTRRISASQLSSGRFGQRATWATTALGERDRILRVHKA